MPIFGESVLLNRFERNLLELLPIKATLPQKKSLAKHHQNSSKITYLLKTNRKRILVSATATIPRTQQYALKIN